MKMGDILVSTLRRKRDGDDRDGQPFFHHYPQTHAYQVVARPKSKLVVVREIGWQINANGFGASIARPTPGMFIGTEQELPIIDLAYGPAIRWTEPMIETAAPYIQGTAYPAELVRAHPGRT